jgi:8-oxo-dGTP pyrophosphatase MutT (NUDIX family)
MEERERVVAYIVRAGSLVAFLHEADENPVLESGLQVPGGGIESGETPEEAVLREAGEETGLDGLRVVRFLGEDVYDTRPFDPPLRRYFFHLEVDGEVPREWRHVERHASDGGEHVFRCFWLPLEQTPLLAGAMGVFVARLSDASR